MAFYLQVANLVGFVIGPSGISWLKSVFLQAEGFSFLLFFFANHYTYYYRELTKSPYFSGLPTLFVLLVTFYIGTKVIKPISLTSVSYEYCNILAFEMSQINLKSSFFRKL